MHRGALDYLPEEDMEASIKYIDSPAALQAWCMSQVADYRKCIAAVRESHKTGAPKNPYITG